MRYLLIFFVLLYSCVDKTSTKITKVETVDTTINIFDNLNPIESKTSIFIDGKIEHEFFTVTTSYNKKFGTIETVVIPKESKISLTKKTESITEKGNFKNKTDSIMIVDFFIFILILILFCVVYITKKFKT